MEIIGYFLAILIGVSLGLMGGGGSILTVPIFVYILDWDPKDAIVASLAVVGLTSFVGSFSHWRSGQLDFRIAFLFGGVAMAGAFMGAKIAAFMSGATQLILFATVMLVAAFFMLRKSQPRNRQIKNEEKSLSPALDSLPYHWIALEGLAVGTLTGIVGVGGGFMIVPALVLLAGVRMKVAVGTSLLIIALNCFSGVVGYWDQVSTDWSYLTGFTGLAILGTFLGSYLIRFVNESALKRSFGVFLIIMGVFILYQNRTVFGLT